MIELIVTTLLITAAGAILGQCLRQLYAKEITPIGNTHPNSVWPPVSKDQRN